MLLMIEKDITGVICCDVHRNAKANNKQMKDQSEHRIVIPHVLRCQCIMSQKLFVDGFHCIQEKWTLTPNFKDLQR